MKCVFEEVYARGEELPLPNISDVRDILDLVVVNRACWAVIRLLQSRVP